MNIFRLLGDLSHLLAIIILLLKIWKTRSCAGKLQRLRSDPINRHIIVGIFRIKLLQFGLHFQVYQESLRYFSPWCTRRVTWICSPITSRHTIRSWRWCSLWPHTPLFTWCMSNSKRLMTTTTIHSGSNSCWYLHWLWLCW